MINYKIIRKMLSVFLISLLSLCGINIASAADGTPANPQITDSIIISDDDEENERETENKEDDEDDEDSSGTEYPH